MSSTETGHEWLSDHDRATLLTVAEASIDHGLEYRRALTVDPAAYPESLQVQRACFVTLEIGGNLRGCIGTLAAVRPLVADVAHNAYAAAFTDPRFPPLTAAERPRLDIHISVLNPARPMHFESESDLLRQLRPGVDGLVLEDGPFRGTFLPSVWESLPDPADFLAQLKRKAGLPSTYWSNTLRVSRYTTEQFP